MKSKKKPAQSAAYLLRRISVWKKRYELVVDSRRAQVDEVKKYRAQVHSLLERKVRELRISNEGFQAATSVLAANNMEIQELKDQVGVQAKLLAEAQSDVRLYQEQAAEVIDQHNRMVTSLRSKVLEYDDLRDEQEQTILLLADARAKLSYRLWIALRDGYYRTCTAIKVECAHRRSRLLSWWAVRRLNKARVTAMNEAGYIPEKLVKVAIAYWEADKQRTSELIDEVNSSGQESKKRQTLWRRIRIWMGRA
jgi:hypothetical protein